MSLIDTTYFVGDISLPVSTNSNISSNLTNSITRYEDEILKKLLGYELWRDFKAGIAEDEPDQKWIDLRDGAEFSFEYWGHTITTKWNGLVNIDKISLIAYYVYYKHKRNNETHSTGLGEVKAKGVNSEAVSSLSKLIWSFNSMVELYGEIPANVIKVRDFLEIDNYEHHNRAASAYNFLLANKETYTNWIFEPIKKINPFML